MTNPAEGETVERYHTAYPGGMFPHQNGRYVLYEDYAALEAKLNEANERLENNHVFVVDGSENLVRKDVEPGSIRDGIDCRDETIRQLEENLTELEEIEKENESLLTQLRDLTSMHAKLNRDYGDVRTQLEETLARLRECEIDSEKLILTGDKKMKKLYTIEITDPLCFRSETACITYAEFDTAEEAKQFAWWAWGEKYKVRYSVTDEPMSLTNDQQSMLKEIMEHYLRKNDAS